MDSEIQLAFEKLLASAPASPDTEAALDADSFLAIVVVFTSAVATVAAMEKAAVLASQLNARISLVVPQVVPYPLPLTSPPVLLGFNENRFRKIASESPVETAVRVYLCRDPMIALGSVLHPHSLVVVGGRKRWWPTAEKRLSCWLRRTGHEVVFVETE